MTSPVPPDASTGGNVRVGATDEWIRRSLCAAHEQVDHYVAAAADYAQKEPRKALGIALAVGYLLRMLPVAGILGIFVRLAFRLLKPSLVAYVGSKAWEKFAATGNSSSGAATTPTMDSDRVA